MLLKVMYEEGFSGSRVMEAAALCQAELPIQELLSCNLLLWTSSSRETPPTLQRFLLLLFCSYSSRSSACDVPPCCNYTKRMLMNAVECLILIGLFECVNTSIITFDGWYTFHLNNKKKKINYYNTTKGYILCTVRWCLFRISEMSLQCHCSVVLSSFCGEKRHIFSVR